MREVWKPIPSFYGRYSVSSKGRVKSDLRRIRFVSKQGNKAWRWKKETIIATQRQNGGYLIAHLHTDNIRTAKTVHSLVAETFLGPRPKGLDVCHRNGIRTDNRPVNLRYGTRSSNLKDMAKHGTLPMTGAKISANQVRKIRKLFASKTYEEIGKKFGISPKAVQRIYSGKSWSSIK